MAEQLRPGLWRLDIPLEGNPLKNLNSYLITGERSLLIDTGFRWESCRSAMERELAQTGVNRDKMDIFLTHLHSDHTGLAVDLIRPDCKTFISRIDGRELLAFADSNRWKQVYLGYVRNGFSREEIQTLWNNNPAQNAAPERPPEFTFLEDGDTLSYGGHKLSGILTPGHTPGHMCLYEAEEKWFFTGDHILFHISPNICRWESVPDSLGDYLESLKKVRDLPASLLLPAHRLVEGNLKSRADELISHHHHRLEIARQVVQDNPGMTAYDIAGKMQWNIRSRSWEVFPLTQKYFAVGEALAHLDYLEVRGMVEREDSGDGSFRYYAEKPL